MVFNVTCCLEVHGAMHFIVIVSFLPSEYALMSIMSKQSI